MNKIFVFLLIVSFHSFCFPDQRMGVPPAEFQGMWKVVNVTGDPRFNAKERREITDPIYYNDLEIRFRKHESGSTQQIWHNETGDVVKSRGIEIESITETTLTYREWRFHRMESKTISLLGDGKAILTWRLPKDSRVYELERIKQ